MDGDREPPPGEWVLPNRVLFPEWVLKNVADRKSQSSGFQLFPHQAFVREYLRRESPFRGLLLYHGLGVGKTCAAIAVAELLLNDVRRVIVMTPASLRMNFQREMLKCGGRDVLRNQRWSRRAGSTGAVWAPDQDRGTPYSELPDTDRESLERHLQALVETRYEFISYNGLRHSHVPRFRDSGYFDGALVVVDEAHRLASAATKQGSVANELYGVMWRSTARFVLLTGTPIVNEPFELSLLLNLVHGPTYVHTVRTPPSRAESAVRALADHPLVDEVRHDPSGARGTLTFTTVPAGFRRRNAFPGDVALLKQDDVASSTAPFSPPAAVRAMVDGARRLTLSSTRRLPRAVGVDRDRSTREAHEALAAATAVAEALGPSARYTTVTEMFHLPMDRDDFHALFVDEETNAMRNPLMFLRRTQGLVSQFDRHDPALYPTVNPHTIVRLPMSDHQFNVYSKLRIDEIKRENVVRRLRRIDASATTGGNVYKAFSRSACNFVFPEGISRPYPSRMTEFFERGSREDDGEEEDDDDGGDGATPRSRRAARERQQTAGGTRRLAGPEYQRELAKAVDALVSSGTLQDPSALEALSPKMAAIVRALGHATGPCLVYSEFRTVEGVRILSLAMEAAGFRRLGVRRRAADGALELHVSSAFPGGSTVGPLYVVNDPADPQASELLRAVFNADALAVPPSLLAQLRELTGRKDVDNLRGDVVRAMLITVSGAEGISLHNVREVHLLEPFWNDIRVQQVIGRAVRAGSHVRLPPEDRFVDVYRYVMELREQQVEQQFVLRNTDDGLTADGLVMRIAETKKALASDFLRLLRAGAVDCNAHASGAVVSVVDEATVGECFNHPAELRDSAPASVADVRHEIEDERYLRGARLSGHVDDGMGVAAEAAASKGRSARVRFPDGVRRDVVVLPDGRVVDAQVLRVLRRVHVVGRLRTDGNTGHVSVVLV